MGQTRAVGFQVGDIVTRDGTDRHRVIATNQDDPRYAADLIDVECLVEPLGFLEEDGVTRGAPWCRVGDVEGNLARRYTYADEPLSGIERKGMTEAQLEPVRHAVAAILAEEVEEWQHYSPAMRAEIVERRTAQLVAAFEGKR